MSVVMIGTAPDALGGIATVVGSYRSAGLFERLDVRYLASHVEGKAWRKLWIAVKVGLQLAGMLMMRRVSVVHVHSADKVSFYRKSAYLLLARWGGAKTIFHLHSGEFAEYAGPDPRSFHRRWIAHTLKHCDVVIALSEPAQQVMRDLATEVRVVIIPNGVELPDATLCTPGEAQRLLFLGNAGYRKGILGLIEVLPHLRQEFPALRLAIGGDGDLDAVRRHASELGVADLIEVLGWTVGEDKIRQILRACIYVLPSRAEGLPMALLECMAYGKAVMTTPVGGIPEAVTDGVNGRLVTPGQIPEHVECLSDLLRDAAQRAHLGAEARRTIEARYSVKHVVSRMLALYEELGVKPR